MKVKIESIWDDKLSMAVVWACRCEQTKNKIQKKYKYNDIFSQTNKRKHFYVKRHSVTLIRMMFFRCRSFHYRRQFVIRETDNLNENGTAWRLDVFDIRIRLHVFIQLLSSHSFFFLGLRAFINNKNLKL